MTRGTITRFEAGGQVYEFHNVQLFTPDFATLRNARIEIAGASGSFDPYGDTPAPVLDGQVRISFGLTAETPEEMTAEIDKLMAMSRLPKGKLYLRVADPFYFERWCTARMSVDPLRRLPSMQTDYMIRPSVTFEVHDPHWYSDIRFVNWGEFNWGDGTTWQSLVVEEAVSGEETTFQLDVGGSIPTRPTLTFTADTAITGITIQRLQGATVVAELSYGAMGANDVLEIDTRAYSVLLNDANAFDASFDYEFIHWFDLEPGENTIRVELGAGESGTLRFDYFETWA